MAQRPQNFRLNRNHPLHKGLVFAGLGGGASTLQMTDASGYGNNGTLTKMTPPIDWVWVPELGRWGVNFDSDSAPLTASGSVFALSGNFCISYWLSTRVANQTDAVIGTLVGAGSYGAFVYAGAAALFIGGTTAANLCLASSDHAHGQFVHVAINYYALLASADFFYDGAFVNSEGHTAGSIGGGPTLLAIGSKPGGSYFLHGTVSDLLIHSRALSPSEIAILANPSDPMLGGLVLPPRRKLWAVVSGGEEVSSRYSGFPRRIWRSNMGILRGAHVA